MSRIGKLPVDIPSSVNISIADNVITAEGVKGKLSVNILPAIKVSQKDNQLLVLRQNDEAESRAKHGLMRTLINNMVVGVSQGFDKKLELNGVGYRGSVSGDSLKLLLGFSHEVVYNLPQGITAAIDQNIITVSGIDKQRVGQVASEIRSLKKPEPYKGKGIKYVGEHILRKSGKSGKEGA